MNKKIFSIFLFKINVIFSISLDLSTIGCDGNCVQEMGKLIEATPSSSSSSSLLLFNEQTLINKFFKNICNSYREVDECLIKCESQSKQVANLKTAYAGLQFNFLIHCLVFLKKGVKLCSSQINRSQETTILFTNAIITREFHSMQMRFSALCRDLSSVIKCMLPLINQSCGDLTASLLLNFIGLEFSSFESLYQQLGFDSPLPISCRSLIKFTLSQKEDFFNKKKINLKNSEKFLKFYNTSNSAISINYKRRKEKNKNINLLIIIIYIFIISF